MTNLKKQLSRVIETNAWTEDQSTKFFHRLVNGYIANHCPEFFKQFDGAMRSKRADLVLALAADAENRVFSQGFAPQLHQFISLIKKYPYPNNFVKPNTTKVAWEAFLKAEMVCKNTNFLIRHAEKQQAYQDPLLAVTSKMRRYIEYVLGETPDLSKVFEESMYGSGASVGVSGNATNFARKFAAPRWTTTRLALPLFASFAVKNPFFWRILLPEYKDRSDWFLDRIMSSSCYPARREFMRALSQRVDVVGYNKIAMVPKTAATDRTIAVEPLLNSFLQKGVDIVMRRKLRRIGIDLSNQERNKHLAMLGSLPFEVDPYCTIDLSAASDTVANELVKTCLPRDWYDLLYRLRASQFSYENEIGSYEKFCSMGNGFCFPLESLLFVSVLAAVGSTDHSVYGDDIIVRRAHFDKTIEALTLCGFTPNPKKTFSKGFFRESCGADWYMGKDVRPVVLDFDFREMRDRIKLHNLTLRSSFKRLGLSEVRDTIISSIIGSPPVRMYPGPDITAFVVSQDAFLASPYSKWSQDTQSWSWFEIQDRPVRDRLVGMPEHEQQLSYHAYSLLGGDSSKPFVIRNCVRLAIKRIANAGALSTWTPNSGSTLLQTSADGNVY